MVTRVFADADVLYSRTLRDWLFLLKLNTAGGMFTVATSVDVVSEAIARYRDNNPDAPGRQVSAMFDRIQENIDERVDDFVIDGSFVGTDGGDQHVDAAVRACQAHVLLTADGGWHGLEPDELDGFPYDVMRPDEFFCLIDDSVPETVAAVTEEQVRYWLGRQDEVDLPARLEAAGCAEFAIRVRRRLQSVDLRRCRQPS